MNPKVRLIYYLMLGGGVDQDLSKELRGLLFDQRALEEMGRIVAQNDLCIGYDSWEVTRDEIVQKAAEDLANEI